MFVIHATLVAFREDVGGYLIYVFQKVDSLGNLVEDSYEMCVQLPNWNAPVLRIGDTGFLKYKQVHAGKDTWYDSDLGEFKPYKWTNEYFVDFVYEKPPLTGEDIIL